MRGEQARLSRWASRGGGWGAPRGGTLNFLLIIFASTRRRKGISHQLKVHLSKKKLKQDSPLLNVIFL